MSLPIALKHLWVSMAFLCTVHGSAAADAAGFQARLEALASAHRVCGVAVALLENRRVEAVATASGCQPPWPLNPNGVFEAASLGKPVLAYAVLQLVEQGRLQLDAPLVSYLPQGYLHLQNPFGPADAARTDRVSDPRLQQLTARSVLNHTTGLPNWSRTALHFDFDPGTRWHYSGEGYLLLQRVVEAVTGEGLDAWMSARLFRPLAMTGSGYVWNDGVAASIVPAMASDGTARKPRPFTAPNAAASLYTSAPDYGRFLAAVLNDPRALAQVVQSPVPVDAGLGLSWGLGWGIERVDDELFLWHWGSNPGYRSFAIASLRTGNGFVLLTDSDDGLALAQPITREVLPGRHRLFQFPMLHNGPVGLACRVFNACP